MPNVKIEVLIICMKCGISYMSHNRILLTYANLGADSQIEDIKLRILCVTCENLSTESG